jgi:hypothetical protein
MAAVFATAIEKGLGGEDWAVGQYRMAQQRGTASGGSKQTEPRV